MPTMSNKDFIPIAGSAYMRFFDKLMHGLEYTGHL